MGLRFRKSKKIGPLRFTVSKSGISTSVGVKGLRVTKTASGRVRTTASIPGTGISYVKESSGQQLRRAAPSTSSQAAPFYGSPALVAPYDGPLPPIPDNYDELIEDAACYVIAQGSASIPFLQRVLNIGYSRASRIIDQLEELGIVGPYDGARPRKVLIPSSSVTSSEIGNNKDAERESQMSRRRSSKKSSIGCLFWVLMIAAIFGACIGVSGNNDSTPAKTTVTLETMTPEQTAPSVRSAALVVDSPAPTETPVPTATPEPAPTPTPEPTPEPTPTPVPVYTYVLNTNTGKFHRTTCASVSDMKESNKAVVETTRDSLIAQGYEPCGRCHP